MGKEASRNHLRRKQGKRERPMARPAQRAARENSRAKRGGEAVRGMSRHLGGTTIRASPELRRGGGDRPEVSYCTQLVAAARLRSFARLLLTLGALAIADSRLSVVS